MKTPINQALCQIPGAASPQYPNGAPSVTTLQHGHGSSPQGGEK